MISFIPSLSTSYPPGTYRAILRVTPTPGTDTFTLNFADMTVTGNTGFIGYVHDAVTGATLSGVNVSMAQGTLYSNVLSNGVANKYTSLSTFALNVPISLNVSKVGYTVEQSTINPVVAGIRSVNFTLTPTTVPHTGLTLMGTVVDSTYARPIPYALVTVRNTTHAETYYRYTNIAGFYLMDEITSSHPTFPPCLGQPTVLVCSGGMCFESCANPTPYAGNTHFQSNASTPIFFTHGRLYEVFGTLTGYTSPVYIKTVTAV